MLSAEQYITSHWIPRKVWTHLDVPKHQERFRTLCKFLEGATFCDVGCACGHSVAHLARINPGVWSGIDFSRTAIDRAKKEFPQFGFYYVEDPSDMTSAGKFDSVICSEVIEHAENPDKLLAALIQIANKVVILSTPCVKVNDPGHIRLYDRPMVDALLAPYPHAVVQTQRFWYLIARSDCHA